LRCTVMLGRRMFRWMRIRLSFWTRRRHGNIVAPSSYDEQKCSAQSPERTPGASETDPVIYPQVKYPTTVTEAQA
jgi:hypothetical protein